MPLPGEPAKKKQNASLVARHSTEREDYILNSMRSKSKKSAEEKKERNFTQRAPSAQRAQRRKSRFLAELDMTIT
jgi:hypothetical protein